MSVEPARTRTAVFDPPATGPVWLASRSPRRLELLSKAGVPVVARPAAVDDGCLVAGRVTPREWVASLAFFKGRAVANDLLAHGEHRGTVLAADTICVHRDRFLGQPRDVGHARAILESLCGDVHVTMTGVCLIALADGRRWFVVDEAVVRIGRIEPRSLEAYLASGEWRGKAGAYNLQDRLDAGWDIRCAGDPATVMGLPMQTLERWFRRVRGDST